jgi:hypothetical protein
VGRRSLGGCTVLENWGGLPVEIKDATQLLDKAGFAIQFEIPPDQEHFGNWMLIATRAPLALRVTNDRGVVLDVMEWNEFEAGAKESDWFTWDVVTRALELKELQADGQLWSFAHNFLDVENAFLRPNWPATRERLLKIEAEKQRKFMGGDRVAQALA